MFKCIGEILVFSVETNESQEYDCDICIYEDDKEYNAYSVHISNRELSFYTDSGFLSYVVDTYDGKHSFELQSIEE